jgi:hypothetical protein
MAEAEYKILVRRSRIFDHRGADRNQGRIKDDPIDRSGTKAMHIAAEELSADVTAHLRNGWSLHGSLSVVTVGNYADTTFTQALFKPSGTTPGGTKPVVTKRQRE